LGYFWMRASCAGEYRYRKEATRPVCASNRNISKHLHRPAAPRAGRASIFPPPME
jgi:hypothetical protein